MVNVELRNHCPDRLYLQKWMSIRMYGNRVSFTSFTQIKIRAIRMHALEKGTSDPATVRSNQLTLNRTPMIGLLQANEHIYQLENNGSSETETTVACGIVVMKMSGITLLFQMSTMNCDGSKY